MAVAGRHTAGDDILNHMDVREFPDESSALPAGHTLSERCPPGIEIAINEACELDCCMCAGVRLSEWAVTRRHS